MTSAKDESLAGIATVLRQREDKLIERERARQVLLAEIDTHKARILETTHRLRRLNNLVDINRLPPEILSEILIHWTNAARVMLAMVPSQHLNRLEWIRIAHVCHHWREVALSTPKLWCHINAAGLNWTREALSRSKKAPLVIEYPRFTSRLGKDHHKLLALVFGELQHIESLTIHDGYSELIKPLEIIPFAPLLSSLSISDRNHVVAPKGQTLSSVLESIAMPKLSRLDLCQTHLSWSTPLLQHSLTRLVFHRSQAVLAAQEQSQSADFARMLEVLDGMPLLEYLNLSNVFPTLRDATFSRLKRDVVLPTLQHLNLTSASGSCAFFLRCLTIPPSASIEISCGYQVYSENDSLVNVTSAFASKLREAGALHTLSYSKTSLRFWCNAVDLDDVCDEDSTTYTQPRFSFNIFSSYGNSSISSALPSLPLDQVHSLVLHAPIFASNDTSAALRTSDVFALMPNVRELAVKESFGDILETLGQHLPPSIDQQGNQTGKKKDFPLPNLKVLRLINVTFREPMDQLDEETHIFQCKKMLLVRKNSQRIIERLVIKRAFNFDNEDRDDVTLIVNEIEWDGIEWWGNGELGSGEDYWNDPDT